MDKYVSIEPFLTDYERTYFYSVRKEGEKLLETEKFIARFSENPEYKIDFDIIIHAIDQIGQYHGAKKWYFRAEHGAEALPPPTKNIPRLLPGISVYSKTVQIDTPQLRLYCVRVSDEIVILLNGGVKTSQQAQGSPDCVDKFNFATRFNQAFNRLHNAKDVTIKGKLLEFSEPEFSL